MPGPPPSDRPAFPAEFLEKCRGLVRRRTVSLAQYQRARLRSCSMNHQPCPTSRLVRSWNCIPIPYAFGVTFGLKATSLWRIRQDADGSPLFPPRDQAVVKAIACEAVSQTQLPLSRLSSTDLSSFDCDRPSHQSQHGLANSRCRRDQAVALRVLDLPARSSVRRESGSGPRSVRGSWESKPLGRKDYIISSDEKTSIQARVRCHPTLPTGPGRLRRVEHEYERGGALQ